MYIYMGGKQDNDKFEINPITNLINRIINGDICVLNENYHDIGDKIHEKSINGDDKCILKNYDVIFEIMTSKYLIMDDKFMEIEFILLKDSIDYYCSKKGLEKSTNDKKGDIMIIIYDESKSLFSLIEDDKYEKIIGNFVHLKYGPKKIIIMVNQRLDNYDKIYGDVITICYHIQCQIKSLIGDPNDKTLGIKRITGEQNIIEIYDNALSKFNTLIGKQNYGIYFLGNVYNIEERKIIRNMGDDHKKHDRIIRRIDQETAFVKYISKKTSDIYITLLDKNYDKNSKDWTIRMDVNFEGINKDSTECSIGGKMIEIEVCGSRKMKGKKISLFSSNKKYPEGGTIIYDYIHEIDELIDNLKDRIFCKERFTQKIINEDLIYDINFFAILIALNIKKKYNKKKFSKILNMDGFINMINRKKIPIEIGKFIIGELKTNLLLIEELLE
jgi:hypothetical protein